MTTVTRMPVRIDGRVPADSFPNRLAIVRAEEGWNYDQAAAATGIGSETWRLWEKRKRTCRTLDETCRQIADATGYSYEWLMVGGSLTSPNPPHDTRPTNPCLSDGGVIVGPWRTDSQGDIPDQLRESA